MSFFIAGQICSRHVEFSYCQTKAEQTRGIQLLAERILQTYWLQWSWEIYLADILIQQRSDMYLANILTRTLARFALPKQLSAGTFLQPPLMSMREGPSACSLLHSKDFLPCANKSTAPHGSYASKHKTRQGERHALNRREHVPKNDQWFGYLLWHEFSCHLARYEWKASCSEVGPMSASHWSRLAFFCERRCHGPRLAGIPCMLWHHQYEVWLGDPSKTCWRWAAILYDESVQDQAIEDW